MNYKNCGNLYVYSLISNCVIVVGGAGWDEWCRRRHRRQDLRGGKINTLNKKNLLALNKF